LQHKRNRCLTADAHGADDHCRIRLCAGRAVRCDLLGEYTQLELGFLSLWYCRVGVSLAALSNEVSVRAL
jgi:hypothetical protein